MYCIDSIKTVGSETVIIGWFFEPGESVDKCQFVDVKDRIDINGYGNPSSDVTKVQGSEASNCRFEFHVPKVKIHGHLDLKLKGGGSRLIPVSSREDLDDHVEVTAHNFSRGRYFSRFKLPKDASVKKVVISMGGLSDWKAYSVKAKNTLSVRTWHIGNTFTGHIGYSQTGRYAFKNCKPNGSKTKIYSSGPNWSFHNHGALS